MIYLRSAVLTVLQKMGNVDMMVRLTWEISTVLTIVLLSFYMIKRDFSIPLTYRTSFSDWTSVESFFRTSVNVTRQGVRVPQWSTLAGVAWCGTASSSAQCACLFTYYHSDYQGYVSQWVSSNITAARLYDLSAQGALACRQLRPSWRKDTCDTVCSVHLITPVMLCCLSASLVLSRVSMYESRLLSGMAYYLPVFLAVLMITGLLFVDKTSGILSCFAILMALVESSYITACTDSIMAYFSCQRFILGTLACWAAVTHQARDLYLVPSYGVLGFLLGFFAYHQRFFRDRQTHITRTLSLYLWSGTVVIAACLTLLVQQNWLYNSPAKSSTVSVVSLAVLCVLQCFQFFQLGDTVQVSAGLAALLSCSVTVLVDVNTMR